MGLMSLFSVDAGHAGSSYFKKQLLRVLVGIGPFCIFYLTDPAFWRRYSKLLYAVNVLMLGAVLLVGRSGGGAQRWIQIGPLDFQPSEIAKLFVILTVSSFFLTRQGKVRTLATFALSFVHILLPLLLVFYQPHLGATLVIMVACLTVSLTAGVRIRFIVGSLLLIVLALVLALRVNGLLQPYQKERVRAMFQANQRGNAYQALRAQIAFGSGGVVGEGYLRGEQKKGRYIPEQHTDFIFTVIGEEGGLLGCTFVLAAFGFFYYRVWLVMLEAKDPYHRMVVAGILGILSFHTIVNLGMNLQLLPVVGLWLPFMSYGGTAMWLCMSCVGLLLNISSREKPVLF
jgi:rod shape determining protein RodA